MASWKNMATELYVDNHTWLSSDITDFSSAVTAFRLDQFALPTNNLNLNGKRWTNSADPIDAQDLTTKQWVLDNIIGVALVGTTNQINVNLVSNVATISIANNPIISGNLGMTGDITSNTNSSGAKTSQSITLTKSGASNLPTLYFGTGSNGFIWDTTNFTITNSLLPTTNNSFSLGSSSFIWSDLFTNNATINALTASQAVVTNGSKQLASLGYATAATANTLAQRDGSGNLAAVGFNGSTAALSGLTTTNIIGIGCLSPANNEILKRNLILDVDSSVSDYQLNLTSDASNGRCAGIGFTITGTGSNNGLTWIYPNHTPGGSIIFERTGTWSLGVLRFLIKNSGTETGSLTNVMNLYNNKVEILTQDLTCNNLTSNNLTFKNSINNINKIESSESGTKWLHIGASGKVQIQNGTYSTGDVFVIVSGSGNEYLYYNQSDDFGVWHPVNGGVWRFNNLGILTCNGANISNINIGSNIIGTNNNNDLSIRRNNVEKIRVEASKTVLIDNADISNINIGSNIVGTNNNNNLSIRRNNVEKIRVEASKTVLIDNVIFNNSIFSNIIYGGEAANTNLILRGTTHANNNGKILIDQNDIDITFSLTANNIITDVLNVNIGAVIEEAQIKNININNSIITTNNTNLSIRRNNVEKIRVEASKTVLIDNADISNINIGNSIIGTNDANNLSIRRNNSEKISVGNSFIRMFESLIVGGSSTTTLNFVINDSILGNGQFFVDLRDTTYNRLRSTQSVIGNSKDLMITSGTTATTPNIYIVSSNNRVGINKNNPDEILDVNGNIKSNGADISNINIGSNIVGTNNNNNLSIRRNNVEKIRVEASKTVLIDNADISNINIGSNIIGTNNNNDLSIRRNNIEYIKLVTLSGGITRSDVISDRCFINWVLTPRINTDELVIGGEDINFDDPAVDSYIKKNGTNRRIIFGEVGVSRLLLNCSSTYSSGNYFQLNSDLNLENHEYIYFSNGRNFGMWKSNVGRVWRFLADGALECLSLTQYSDLKIKKNIELVNCGDSLNKIKNINIYKFNYIDEKDEDKKHVGVIANEVEEYIPEVVKTVNTQYKGVEGDLKNVNTTELNYLIINCIKELKNEIDQIRKSNSI